MTPTITPTIIRDEVVAARSRGPLDVIFVNDSGAINGGTARVAIGEARHLAGRGHRVTFLAGFGPVDPSLSAAGVRVELTGQSELVKDGVPLRALAAGIRNRTAERKMVELLDGRSTQHTVVHLHGWTKCLSASVVRPAIDRGFSVICTLHDYFSACPNGGLYDFQRNASCALTPMSWSCIGRHCDKHSYAQKLYRVGRHWAQQQWHGVPGDLRYFATVSPFSRNLLSPYLPPEATLFDLPNPIDVERRAPSQPEKRGNFLFVGRLSPEKGPAVLAAAGAGRKVAVTFVGDGPERSAIEKLMPASAMTGWLPPSEVQEQMRRCRAIICPSVCYETQGIVVQEAAALGVPAIVSDGCAARDSVADGVTGLWFRSGDANDLWDKMARFGDRSLADRMGKAAYERFWDEPMTPDVHVESLEQIYDEILRRETLGRSSEVSSGVSASVAGMSE